MAGKSKGSDAPEDKSGSGAASGTGAGGSGGGGGGKDDELRNAVSMKFDGFYLYYVHMQVKKNRTFERATAAKKKADDDAAKKKVEDKEARQLLEEEETGCKRRLRGCKRKRRPDSLQ